MLPYLTGLSHAAIIACLLVVLNPAMRQDRNHARALVVVQDDCYLPHGGMEYEARPLNVRDVERIYE